VDIEQQEEYEKKWLCQIAGTLSCSQIGKTLHLPRGQLHGKLLIKSYIKDELRQTLLPK